MISIRSGKPIITFIAFIFFLATLGILGCSSGGSSGDSGEVVIGLTDAQGDFAGYTLDIISLTLTKANGTVVETLPLTTRLDFSKYTDMTEFLTASTVPAGIYTGATMTLDYRNAEILVEDTAGDAVLVETIVDENGNAITTFDVTVYFESSRRLLIAPGIPAHLTLDFDLKTSNHVTFDQDGVPELTVDPELTADINPESPKIHRLRGPLKHVDVAGNSFTLIIRPFRHAILHDNERFGKLMVIGDNETIYNINDQTYTGEDGLTALDNMPSLSAVVVIGDLKFHPARFEANEVRAGSSVPGGTLDAMTGNVSLRDNNTITVKGVSLTRSNGSVAFNDEVMVLLGENTIVRRQLSTDPYDIDDISIGQSITVFGTLSENDGQPELDATNGHATLLLTVMSGPVVKVDPLSLDNIPLAIDLKLVNHRSADLFDFENTGADPENYGINPGEMDISSLEMDDSISVRGFVTPYDENGPDVPDFNAVTIVNFSGIDAFLKVHWFPASTSAFADVSADGLTMDLFGTGIFHHLVYGPVVTDLTDLPDPPVIVPKDDGQGTFVLIQHGSVQLFEDFALFIAELETRLADDGKVRKVFAKGDFDAVTATMASQWINVTLW